MKMKGIKKKQKSKMKRALEALKRFWAENIRKNYKKISVALSSLLSGGITTLMMIITYLARSLDPALSSILITFLATAQISLNTIVVSVLGKKKDGNGYHKDGFLIVDDDEVEGSLLCKGLRKEKYECEYVDDIEDAQNAVYRKDYDVLLIANSVANGKRGKTIIDLVHKFKYADPDIRTIVMIDPEEYTEKISKRLGNLSNETGIQLVFKPFKRDDIIRLLEDRSCWR